MKIKSSDFFGILRNILRGFEQVRHREQRGRGRLGQGKARQGRGGQGGIVFDTMIMSHYLKIGVNEFQTNSRQEMWQKLFV